MSQVNSLGGRTASLDSLPDDILGNVFERLELSEMMGLMAVGSRMKTRVSTLGVPLFLTNNPLHHVTLSVPPHDWHPAKLLKHNMKINRSLSNHKWHALQVGPTWSSSVISTMSLSPDRILYGVGGRLLVHDLDTPASTVEKAQDLTDDGHMRSCTKSARRSKEYHIARKWAGSAVDIIGVAELNDELKQIVIAQFDGTLQRFSLPRSNTSDPIISRSTAHYPHPPNSAVHTLSVSNGGIMTTTSSGLLSLFRASSPWTPPDTLQLKENSRAWSTLLTMDNSSVPPTAFIGTFGSIQIFPLDSTGSLPSSSIPTRRLEGPKSPVKSSAYDLALPPAPSWHHPQTLLSAWYDSTIRLHDLRSSSPQPFLTLSDPWADSPMYSCTFTGGYHVAGGGARHGMVGIWDVRYPKNGWSCFTPGGKRSPVYQLKGEGGRIWGVTERRGFCLAFDGSGDEIDGIVMNNARCRYGNAMRGKSRVLEVPTKFRSRGGKWGWGVRYQMEDKEEIGIGYEHRDRIVQLFDSSPVV